MSKRIAKTKRQTAARVLGAKTFAVITAVEGLHLSATSKRRLATLNASDLTPEQRRAEVLRAYTPAKDRR